MAIFFNTLAIALTILVGAIHIYAIEHSLYWYYLYFDAIPHVLAGVAVGAWSSAVAARLSLRPSHMALFALGAVLVVSGAWELFEYSSGLTDIHDPLFISDTLQDFACAILGAMLVALLYIPLYRKFLR